MAKNNKVILAYSGGLDTSVILKWLIVERGYEVVTVTADLGQEDDLDGVEPKALKTGATKAYIEDLRDDFAKDYIYPMLRSGATYEGRYLMGTSIARPLISKRLVEIARREGAFAIAHGATGKGNDQVRFELAVNALAPDLQIIAPWREWDLMSRTALTAFAEKHGIPVNASNKHYSMDRNMLHCSFEGSELEDPWEEPGPNSYVMAVPVEQAPNEPEYITIGYEKGDAVTLNGERLSPREMVMALNRIAGKHGIGRLDMVENRFVGMKSRGVYETPGGTILYRAHEVLEMITLDKDTKHMKTKLAVDFADLIYNGKWFTPLREALQAFAVDTQKYVTGTVKLKLYKGNIITSSVSSPCTLYSENLVTFEESDYDQKDSQGFINLWGLPDKVQALREQGKL